MSKPSPLSRSSSSESPVEASSQETPAKDEQSKTLSPPIMKTKIKKNDQQEAYEASTTATYIEKNVDIGKNSKTEIDTENPKKEKIQQWTKFSKNIHDNGILVLNFHNGREIQDLVEWLSQSESTKMNGILLVCWPNALSENEYSAAKKLAKFIQTNTSITSLEFYGSSIDNQSYEYFAEAIKTNTQTKITTLKFSNESIDDKGVKVLAKGFNTNTTITTLGLSGNGIRAEGAEALSETLKINATITTLDLSANGIRAEGAEALSETLKINATITTLNLRNNKIQDKGTKALAESLKTNITITTLDLLHNKISDESAIALAEVLKTNKNITTLFLNKNVIGDEGAIAFAEALKTNTTITTLNLFSNNISDDGAIAFAEALKNNTTITTLNLSGCYISIDGARALAKAMETNTTITELKVDHFNKSDDEYKKLIAFIDQQCELNAKRIQFEDNITDTLDLMTAHPNPNDGNKTSITDVNKIIAEKLFTLDKADKLNTTDVIKDPNSVFNKYT